MSVYDNFALNRTDENPSASPLIPVGPAGHPIDKSEFLNQIDRILRSNELHGAEVLRRLLKFLAQKSISGEADDLKEYIVAIEGLGKPTTYDPRYNSAVRLQVGRLRLKLSSYYQGEGQHDKILIDLPKGRFKLTCEMRESPIETRLKIRSEESTPASTAEAPALSRSSRITGVARAAAWLAAGVALAIAGQKLAQRAQPAQMKASSVAYPAGWDPSIDEIWKPFVTSSRPMIVAIDDPLFVSLDSRGGLLLRDKNLDSWDKVVSSPDVAKIRTLVKGNDLQPIRYYTAYQEANASFMLAKLLGSRVPTMSVVKSTDVSMRDVADNNIVFIGIQNEFFAQQMKATPIESPLEPVPEGIRNLRPAANEPGLFADHYSMAPSEEGFAYALVTHLPGPLGNNDVESFTSSRAAGYSAAVKAFTDPGFVRVVVAKLKETNQGQMPKYYQVLLKIRFKVEVPTEITYVLSRELHYQPKQ